MKKKKILLSLLCVGAVLGTASCKVETETPTPTPTTPEVVPTNPETGSTPTTPVVTSYKATLVYNNGAENGSITSVEDGGKYYFDKPSDPVKQYHKFAGWYTDEALTQPFNFNSEVSADITLYAKFVAAYDTVNTIWNILESAQALQPEATSGKIVLAEVDKEYVFQDKISIVSNGKTYFELKSGQDCINTQGADLKFVLSGSGNTNSFTMNFKYASDPGVVTIKNADTGQVVHSSEYEKNAEDSITKSNLPAGTYVLSAEKTSGGGASVRVYALSLGEQLPQGPTSGISISTAGATTNFLKGRAFNATGLNVTLDYENGRQDALSSDKYTISNVDMSTAGKKTVTITYQLNATTTYTDTYEVVVWEAKSLNVYDYTYNGTTNHARFVYFSDETAKSVDNITVKALCTAPEVNGTYEFKLNANEYTVDKTNTNKIEFTYGDLDAEFNYVTVNKVDLSAEEMIVVTVNPDADVVVSNDAINFKTIMQAMQFLNMAKASDDAKKLVVLSGGKTYNEKVEITLPNLILVSDFAMEGKTGENAIIEYGLLAGDTEPGENGIFVTDGSATVSIRESAEGFIAQNITFVNSYNTYAEYEVAKGLTKDTQGVAALVQADKAMFGWCSFSGYQDTLYAQVGRQYYQECYIEGHTDFIFGYDATAYFYDCTIKSIGAGADQNNGGYVVATKGNTSTAIEFGYVFDDCDFVAEENTVMPGSISLGRTWDSDMTMMVMNSSISGAYSTEAFGTITPDNPNTEAKEKDLNDRYGQMSGTITPAKITEYNNTGDGAISASLKDTCTVLTAEQAAKYTPANIFTANNGGTKYTSSWNPLATESATVVLKDANDAVLLTVKDFGSVGSAATKAEYEALITSELIPSGKDFGGFYTDKEFTTEYEYNTTLIAETVIYVKWIDLAATKSVSATFTSEDGTKAVYNVENWSVTMAEQKSTNIGAEIGLNKDATSKAKCPNLQPGDSITSATFDNATNNVKVIIIGATTGTSKAAPVIVEALDSEGNVVTTIKMNTTLNKTTGYFTFEENEYGILTSATNNITAIKISVPTVAADANAKQFCVLTCEIIYDIVE